MQNENFLQTAANFTNYTSLNCYLRFLNLLTAENVVKWQSVFNKNWAGKFSSNGAEGRQVSF